MKQSNPTASQVDQEFSDYLSTKKLELTTSKIYTFNIECKTKKLKIINPSN